MNKEKVDHYFEKIMYLVFLPLAVFAPLIASLLLKYGIINL